MPIRRPIFRDRAALAQCIDTNGPGPLCQYSATVVLHEAESKCAISIQTYARFEGFSGLQRVSLRIPGEIITQLQWHFDAELIPDSVKDQLIKNRLHAPQDNDYRILVRDFQSLCRATDLVLYIPAPTLSDSQQRAINALGEMVTSGTLASLPLDSRHAVHEKTWEIFNIVENPPPYARPLERESNKRRREYSPRSDNPMSYNLDPSTPPAATPMTPAFHLHDSVLINALRGIIQGVLHEALPGMLRHELEVMLPPLVREALPAVVEDLLPKVFARSSETSQPFRAPLSPIVRDQLPGVLQDYIDENDVCDSMIETVSLHVEETVQDSVLDVKIAKEGFIETIEGLEQRVVEKILNAETEATERLSDTIWHLDEKVKKLEEERAARKAADNISFSILDAQIDDGFHHPPSSTDTTAGSGLEDLDAGVMWVAAQPVDPMQSRTTRSAPANIRTETSSKRPAAFNSSPTNLFRQPTEFIRGSTTEPDTEPDTESEAKPAATDPIEAE